MDVCMNGKSKNIGKDISKRERGEAPVLGHHIDPEAQDRGDSDDWNHPNIAPLTPAENYSAHVLRILSNPTHPKELEELKNMTANGMLDTAEKFEAYIIKLYDQSGKFDNYVDYHRSKS